MKEDQKLQLEGARATEMLRGKTVAAVWRHGAGELGLQFADGTRLFVDHTLHGLELSITGGGDDAAASESTAGPEWLAAPAP